MIANTVDSRVELNPRPLAGIIGTTPEEIEKAIEFLCRPDPESRNTEREGRRLVQEGRFQYFVVSHAIYRSMRDEEERRAYNARKQREHREKKKNAPECQT
ncbi:hypothetical protein [Mesoterricola sediminis]|uniref:hypothetical protein n=1 Tax=Mesoterricola sediminis TaxID=2927980 RepID=UPI00292D57C8|nr:hypothetical protein [Mesoterricola sediminis]